MLTTPWLSSSLFISWMVTMEIWLVWYCWWCTVVVVVGICCDLILINPTAGEPSEKTGKVFSSLISCRSKAPTPKAQHCSFRACKILSPEVIYAKDTRDLWASHNGVFLPFIPSQAHFRLQYSQLLGSPHCSKIHMDSAPTYLDFFREHCVLIWTKALYSCGSDAPGHPIHWIHTVQ